jgi:RNA polymerase primary sigma factor
LFRIIDVILPCTNKINVMSKLSPSISQRNYFKDLVKIKKQSPKDQELLFGRIQQGDERAINELIEANLRYVVSVARKYKCKTLSEEDLISEGNIGLIKAAKHFDPSVGVKFITYARYAIEQAIFAAMGNNDRLIRIPKSASDMMKAIRKAKSQLEAQGLSVTAAAISDLTDIAITDIDTMTRAMSITVSLDQPTSEDDDYTLAESLMGDSETDSELMRESTKISINRIMQLLSPREADIVKAFYGISKETPDQVANRFGLTSTRVAQIRDVAIARLSSSVKSKTVLA